MYEYAPYVIIPFLTGFVGWFTNWLGIKMMLYPANWLGIWKIGWQGIIPHMRVRLTKTLVRNSISIICTPQEMIEAMDEANAIEQISELISPQLDNWIEDILSDQYPTTWPFAPRQLKKEIYKLIATEMPGFAHSVLKEIERKADYYIQIEEIAAFEADKNPEIVTKLVLAIGKTELDFIIRSGLFFGIPIGCFQAITWYFYKGSFVLPMYGLLAGAVTNWLAMHILFYPASPIKVFGFEVQGLFIKRQADVAVDFSTVFMENFIDVQTLLDNVWNGKHKDEIQRIIRREFENFLDKKIITGNLLKALKMSGQIRDVNSETISSIQDDLVYTISRPQAFQQLFNPVNLLIEERMSRLSAEQFQNLLLPIFEQDKWIIIGVGGALGFCAGTAQLIFLFGGSLLVG